MSTGNQVWADDITTTFIGTAGTADAGRVLRLGEKRFQLASDTTLRNLATGDIADPGERVWVFVAHLATEAVAWALGNSIQRDSAAGNPWDGELVDAAGPSREAVLGLAQFAFATSVLRYGYIGFNGPFEGLTDNTVDANEGVIATNNSGNGSIAGVAYGASMDAQIGHALEADAGDDTLVTVMLSLS